MSNAVIKDTELLLKELPNKYVYSYERKILGGRTVASVLASYKEALEKRRHWGLASRCFSILGAPMVIFAILVLCFEDRGLAIILLGFGLLCVLGHTTAHKEVSNLDEPIEHSKKTLRSFKDTVGRLTGTSNGSPQPYDFNPATIQTRLVQRAIKVVQDEISFNSSKSDPSSGPEEMVTVANVLQRSRWEFNDLWDAIGIFEALSPKDYEKKSIFAQAKRYAVQVTKPPQVPPLSRNAPTGQWALENDGGPE